MAEWPGTGGLLDWQEHRRDWVTANNACRCDLLERLRAEGPLPQRELHDTCVQPWASSGWNNNRNGTMMLDFLVQRGEVAAARAGHARSRGLKRPVEPVDVGEAGEPAVVEGVKGLVDPSWLEQPFSGRAGCRRPTCCCRLHASVGSRARSLAELVQDAWLSRASARAATWLSEHPSG